MSNKWAYYNEIDPFAAQWLRNLMSSGLIAQGVVDERSISDVKPAEIQEFTQCHFFAGIGVWSYALRAAGWDDHRPVWTGSCPCQPFSSAGKGDGLLDERHLWPHWFHLIQMCRPIEIFGEQVSSKDGLAWLDIVQTDLEEAGYTNAALDLCAAGFGAPHIRQRLWLYARRRVANASSNGRQWNGSGTTLQAGHQERPFENWELQNRPEGSSVLNLQQASLRGRSMELEHPISNGLQGRLSRRENPQRETEHRQVGCDSPINLLADSNHDRQQPGERGGSCKRSDRQGNDVGWGCEAGTLADSKGKRVQGTSPATEQAGRENIESNLPVNGHWLDANWIYCRDEKYRPIEPCSFPLVNVPSASVVRTSTDPETVRRHPKIRKGALKGYGNAIVAEVAKEFIKAAMDYKP